MNRKIMIVDDNYEIRRSVELICESADLSIVTASEGEQCLQLLEGGFRGIILMDVMMPNMDGWDTIRQIIDRGLYPGNIIIMLTGLGEPDAKMEGMQEYVTDYLTKPFGTKQLLEALSYYMAIQQTPPPNHE